MLVLPRSRTDTSHEPSHLSLDAARSTARRAPDRRRLRRHRRPLWLGPDGRAAHGRRFVPAPRAAGGPLPPGVGSAAIWRAARRDRGRGDLTAPLRRRRAAAASTAGAARAGRRVGVAYPPDQGGGVAFVPPRAGRVGAGGARGDRPPQARFDPG